MQLITAIGDSITEGFPFRREDSWVELAARELGIDIVNRGVCGDLTRDMLRRFPQDVLGLNPTHVIIMGGTNDAFARLPLSTVSANYQAMVELSCKNNILPIFGLPVPSIFPEDEGFLSDYREWLEEYAQAEDIPVIDFYSPFNRAFRTGKGRELLGDGVHPSLAGYRLMAKTAFQVLKLGASDSR